MKYHSVRTWSNLCNCWFASKTEAIRAGELHLLERAGEISDLEYQPKFLLSKTPKVTYTADFRYLENGKVIVEDCKGVLTRDCRTKMAWVREKFNIEVKLT